MPKRLYIPEWDGIYPPKKKSDSANKINNAQKTYIVKKNKGKTTLIIERGKLEEKCDTFHKCKQEESCNSCEIFKKIQEIDTKIENMEKIYIRKEGKEISSYSEPKCSKEEENNEKDEKYLILIENVELEKLTRRKLISLTKDCGITLKSPYKLNKVEIIRKIRKSKIGENKLHNLFLQYINMYYCEYCRLDHYFDSNIGKRHQKYQKELIKERQKTKTRGNIRLESNHAICKYCGKKYINERFLKKHVKNSHFLPIDLHRMSLNNSIVYVKSKLDECVNRGVNGLKLIHGYHKGTTIRDYFRSDKFKTDMKDAGFTVSFINIRDLGYTLVGVSK